MVPYITAQGLQLNRYSGAERKDRSTEIPAASPGSRRFPTLRLTCPHHLCLAPLRPPLSFGSGLLTLFTRRGAVKTYLTRYRQLLTRGSKGLHPSQGSRICEHCTFTTTPTDEET